MSKKYRNKPCAYCGHRTSESADHVFAREFFAASARAGLPQVPSCNPCNNAKSVLEHNLTAVLPFGSRHPEAVSMLHEQVPKRLARNQRLRAKIAAGMREHFVSDGRGNIERRITIPIEPGSLEQLFAYITRGLIYFHWHLILPPEYATDSMTMTAAAHNHWAILKPHPQASHLISRTLGNGVIRYDGFQSSVNPCLTSWKYEVFGGLQLSGDSEQPDAVATMIIGRSVRRLDLQASARAE